MRTCFYSFGSITPLCCDQPETLTPRRLAGRQRKTLYRRDPSITHRVQYMNLGEILDPTAVVFDLFNIYEHHILLREK